jgi:DNA-binding winged helix-turn-helix (wHTH) protein/tetratricopeptide (TPR) repeat protein/molybdopterin-guanine dinucleotide biosynthesis protein
VQLSATTVDLETGLVTRGGGEVHLTPAERQLLAFLARHPRTPVARQTLLQSVWGYDRKVRSRTVDTTMKTLRKKVERDPRQPDHLHTVRGVGYRFVPRVQTSDTVVGRADLLGRVIDAVSPGRVVTLVGVAGVGKTTLAREVLQSLRGVFVPLGTASGADEVVAAIAGAVVADGSVTTVSALAQRLDNSDHEVLVVDNAEQAVAALRALLPQLGAAVPVVVTSRVPLGIDDEVLVPVEGLPLAAAVELLRREVGSTYAQVDDSVLERIVERVDRLPLGVELVAARARWLSPAQVLERLDDPVSLLPSGPGRHGSMDAALAWSFEALSPSARSVLRVAAVFEGPFDVPAVEAAVQRPLGEVVDALAQLQAAGWLRRDDDGTLHTLVLLRSHARQALPCPERVHPRLARHLVDRCGRADGPATRPWAPTARALATRLADRDPDLAARLQLIVVAAYASSGPAEARYRAASKALQWCREDGLVARCLLARAEAAMAGGQPTCLDDLHRAADHAEIAGDRGLLGKVLGRRGTVLFLRGRLDEAEPLLQRALELHLAVGDRRSQANRLANLANVALRRNRLDEARQRFLEALALHESMGNALSAARVMGNLGVVNMHQHRLKRARSWFERALQAHRALDHTPGVVRAQANLGVVELQLGHLRDADERFVAAAERCAALGEPLLEGIAWLNRASIAVERLAAVDAERCIAKGRLCLQRADASAYLAVLAVLALLAEWPEAAQPDALEAALPRLAPANRCLAWAAAGLLAAVGREWPLPEPSEHEQRWLDACRRHDLSDIEAFARGPGQHEAEVRMVAALLAAGGRDTFTV